MKLNQLFTYSALAIAVSATGQIAEYVEPNNSAEAYQIGDKVVYQGNTYQSSATNNVLNPVAGKNLWQQIRGDFDAKEFVQPTGYHNAYQLGERMIFDQQVYRSIVTDNVWSPINNPSAWEVEKANVVFQMDWYNAAARTLIKTPQSGVVGDYIGYFPQLDKPILLGQYTSLDNIDLSIESYWGEHWYGPISINNQDFFKQFNTANSRTYTFEDAKGWDMRYNDGQFTLNLEEQKRGKFYFEMLWYNAASETTLTLADGTELITAHGYFPTLPDQKSYIGEFNSVDDIVITMNTLWRDGLYGPVYDDDQDFFKVEQTSDTSWTFTFEDAANFDSAYNDGAFEITMVPNKQEYLFEMNWYNAAGQTEIYVNGEKVADYHGYYPELAPAISLGEFSSIEDIDIEIKTYWHDAWYGPVSSENNAHFIRRTLANGMQYTFEDAVLFNNGYDDGQFTIYRKP